MRKLWRDIVSFWDEHEAPTSIALVRICLAACWLYDLLHIWQLDLVLPLFAVEEAGGWSPVLARSPFPWVTQLLAPTAEAAVALHTTMTLAALSLLLGFFTRTSALVLLVAWLQWVHYLPTADRGIDQLSRHMLLLLAFAPSGRTMALDAVWRSGSWWGDGQPVPSWPRKLVIAQMVLMYFTAGVLKSGVTWWPMGGYAALYFALQDPSVAAADFGWVRQQPFFFFTQVGTAVTVIYQATYPLVLLLFLWRRRPELGGRLAAWCNRYPIEWLWLGIGAWFHVSLAVVMNLGIFPWAMLALYPAWVEPRAWSTLAARLRPRPSAAPSTPSS
jgi:hypothetical protein